MKKSKAKKFKLIILLIFISACKNTPVNSTDDNTMNECTHDHENGSSNLAIANLFLENEEEGPDPTNKPVCAPLTPINETHLTYNVTYYEFTEEIETKVRIAFDKLIVALNSIEFRDRVLMHQYEGETKFANNDNLTNEEIYKIIMDGIEELDPITSVDNEMDMQLELYYSSSSTIGYTYPSDPRIYLNSKYYKNYESGDIARNVVHEWTHKLGFKHDSGRTARRPYSVPYAVGNIIKDLVARVK